MTRGMSRESLFLGFYVLSKLISAFFLTLVFLLFSGLVPELIRVIRYIQHGMGFSQVIEYCLNHCLSLTPYLFPISLLVSILVVSSRLFRSNEIFCFYSLGFALPRVSYFVFGFLVTILSYVLTFYVGPSASYRNEVLKRLSIKQKKNLIKEKVFFLDAYDRVIYANSVSNHQMKHIFFNLPYSNKDMLAVMAYEGELKVPDVNKGSFYYNLRLKNGFLYDQISGENLGGSAILSFREYEFQWAPKILSYDFSASIRKFNVDELNSFMSSESSPFSKKEIINYKYRMWGLVLSCFIWALLAFSFQPVFSRSGKVQKRYIFALCLLFWVLYFYFISLSQKGLVHPVFMILIPHGFIVLSSLWILKKSKLNLTYRLSGYS